MTTLEVTTEKYTHLTAETAEFMELSISERIEKIQLPRWIGYSTANHILNKMEELLNYPPRHRMPNLLIIGNTNNGKTMVVNHFKLKNPARENEEDGTMVLPVFMIQAPPVPDEARFYNSMLESLFSPYRQSDRPDRKQFQVIKILKHLKTRMLIIDEIHNIIAGPQLKQRLFLNTIKYLCNELQIPLVALGTEEAYNAIQTDHQLSNRFEPIVLPKWEIGNEYLRLLASFEKMIPLKYPSKLINLALQIHRMSEGLIGEIDSILTKAAIKAVQTKSEKITIEILNKIDWTAPSARKWKLS